MPLVTVRYGDVVPGIGYVGPGDQVDLEPEVAAGLIAQGRADPVPGRRETAALAPAVERAAVVEPPPPRRRRRKRRNR